MVYRNLFCVLMCEAHSNQEAISPPFCRGDITLCKQRRHGSLDLSVSSVVLSTMRRLYRGGACGGLVYLVQFIDIHKNASLSNASYHWDVVGIDWS